MTKVVEEVDLSFGLAFTKPSYNRLGATQQRYPTCTLVDNVLEARIERMYDDLGVRFLRVTKSGVSPLQQKKMGCLQVCEADLLRYACVYTVQDWHCKNTKRPTFEERRFFQRKKHRPFQPNHPLVGSGSKASDVLMAVEELERELAQEIVFW